MRRAGISHLQGGDNVYSGGKRIFYVVDGAIYDNGGARQFHIAGLWWYDRNGRPAYYQDREITEPAPVALGLALIVD
jgi:hypothetical protein